MKITTKDGTVFEGTQAGDIVVVTSTEQLPMYDYFVGDVVKIIDTDCGGDSPLLVSKPDTQIGFTNVESIRKATLAEVDAYEKALHKASFRVGDYVIGFKSERGNEGKIAKITKISDGLYSVNIDGLVVPVDLEGQIIGDSQVYGFKASEVVKATEQEVADALEAVKWAKIGRKVGDFKVGDIVEVNTEDKERLYTVTVIDGKRIYFDCDLYGRKNEFNYAQDVKLIAPVESTFK